MKVAIYARVSTDDKGQNPESQLLSCRNYCQLYKHETAGEFVDEGISGDSLIWERPAGAELKKLLDAGAAQGLVVFSIDRFSRQSPFKVNEQLEALKQRGITFISVSEPMLNTDSDFAPVVQFMMTWFSNYFLTQHKKKVKSGIERKMRETGRWGRKPLSGWHRNRIIAARKEGKTIRAIAAELGVSAGVVHKTLKKISGVADSQESGSSE
jgi:DNA invertase Pin-like site-specific DNA recombinase